MKKIADDKDLIDQYTAAIKSIKENTNSNTTQEGMKNNLDKLKNTLQHVNINLVTQSYQFYKYSKGNSSEEDGENYVVS